MDITFSGGDLGGNVYHADTEPAIGTLLTQSGFVYRYIGGGIAVYAGVAD